MRGAPFVKMHGLGNDFVVLDARTRALDLTDAQVRAIADRRTGVGCDQLIVVRPARDAGADAFMEIRNADGGEVEACGNATRCVAGMLMGESGRDAAIVQTVAGLLGGSAAAGGRVTVDMGVARTGWAEIPLREACDTLHVPLSLGPLGDPVATNIGNPHATFFVANVDEIDLATLGPQLEHHPIFPQRANIGVAHVTPEGGLRLRVWERGVGITQACGTGACAAMVAAVRRGLTGRRATIVLDGGPLEMEWRADGHVMMTGAIATSFSGFLDASLLG
ncbi:diaminopimelate epimerase [Constrictibacter sp. MBR-5]|uniref:diaminopimelate epimerase n=1 Tax=Constrictibacter sp. MBR-5 TaxID=3156467 RepID=UPI003399218F